MEDVFNKLIRRVLALTIRCPKRPRTKGDILRCALKHYLKYGRYGLCYEIRWAVEHYKITNDLIVQCHGRLYIYFFLFKRDIAIRLFNGSGDLYWWPTEDWKNRYRYMRWLIKEYDKEAL